LKKFLIELAINALGFFIAITLLTGRGIEAQGENVWVTYVILALIFAVINAILRPILSVLGCPLIILTLGLGVLVINTLLFALTGIIGTRFGVGFSVDGFWPAFLGALVVSLVGVVLHLLLGDQLRDQRRRDRD
jgi:putative membrane protein